MHRDRATTSHLGCVVAKLDRCADLTSRPYNHVPGQVSNLSGPQASFHRKQNDDAIAIRLAVLPAKKNKSSMCWSDRNLCLLARISAIQR